jgi:hypothetical protein
MTSLTYPNGAENQPAAQFSWLDASGAVIDFSHGWTFKIAVAQPPNAAALVKTTGMSGLSTSPNLILTWSVGDLKVLTPGIWQFQITATQTSTGSSRVMTGTIQIINPTY